MGFADPQLQWPQELLGLWKPQHLAGCRPAPPACWPRQKLCQAAHLQHRLRSLHRTVSILIGAITKRMAWPYWGVLRPGLSCRHAFLKMLM